MDLEHEHFRFSIVPSFIPSNAPNRFASLARAGARHALAAPESTPNPHVTLIDDSILMGFHNSLTAKAIPTKILIYKKGKGAARISREITVASLTDLINRESAE